MNPKYVGLGCVAALLIVGLTTPAFLPEGECAPPRAGGLVVGVDAGEATLSLGEAPPFHRTARPIINERLLEIPGSPVRLVLWEEMESEGGVVSHYAISLDGRSMATVRATSYTCKLRYGEFDPRGGVPPVEAAVSADQASSLYIVQFVTQPLEEFRQAVRNLGGTVYHFLANHAHVVKMNSEVRDAVAALPYVRWVGPYHPAYRLEPDLLAHLTSPAGELPPTRYSFQVFERGRRPQRQVADRIVALGGTVHLISPAGFRMEATLTGDQLLQIVRLDEVAFIDRAGPLEADMDIVREVTGANYIEQIAGYTGQGVRGEVFDQGVFSGHCDFQSNPILFHTPNPGSHIHGTGVTGIVFGDGTCNPAARGMLPDGSPIFANYTSGADPYAHTAELVNPLGPYQAVFQTRSVGGPRTSQYTTVSAEMDDILFLNDILVTQVQGNGYLQDSRPEAWAKNAVSVGGVVHQNNLTPLDDCWCNLASIGPASDGRIKPDFVHFYDNIFTTSGGCYDCYGAFGGTSASTPMVAGSFGLFFQMWADGIFGNPVDPNVSVFANRPHMTTAKAMMINAAAQYPFSGVLHDLTRTHQGWGLPDVRNLFDARDGFFFIDEEEVLSNLQIARYELLVQSGEPAVRATLVYADPPGSPASTQHRINDLTLKVITPSQIVYWGNNGLLAGNWSTPGGLPNTVDTVENVFIQDPEPGTWTVEVHADEINQDSHLQTPQIDADFALVVSGVTVAPGLPGDMNCDGAVTVQDVSPLVLALIDADAYTATFHTCSIINGDTNQDGRVDGDDVSSFVGLLLP